MKKNILIKSNDHPIEKLRNTLLVAFYEGDCLQIESLFSQIRYYFKTHSDPTEYEEKLYRQINVMVKVLVKKVESDLKKSGSANLISSIKDFKHSLSHVIKKNSRNTKTIGFKSWEDCLGLEPAQKEMIYKTAMTFQLSSGCSNFCRRCNEWALPKVRSHFSFEAVKNILKKIADQNNTEISLYGASDPLDWEGKDSADNLNGDQTDILDIIKFITDLPLDYSLLTKVPKGKKNLLKKLVKADSNISVSITKKNKTRIQSLEDEITSPLAQQHDLDELLIPAGLDEDFVSIKPSITDGYGTEITPDGAYIIIPTFTSALHPFGHKKISITPDTHFFPLKKTGRHALLVDYFKPLEGYNSINLEHIFHNSLLDIQIESILLDNGSDELTPPGMRSLWEYFSIFEEKARLQRKKMTPTVFKRLRKKFIGNSRFKDLSENKRIEYMTHINSHLKLCDKSGCQSAKVFSISYILNAIHHYLEGNDTKAKIIKSLLIDEINLTNKTIASTIDKGQPIAGLMDSKIDTFKFFRYLIFQLFENKEDSQIKDFLSDYPARYDSVADIFVSDLPGK